MKSLLLHAAEASWQRLKQKKEKRLLLSFSHIFGVG